jgi:hypothetical protein
MGKDKGDKEEGRDILEGGDLTTPVVLLVSLV